MFHIKLEKDEGVNQKEFQSFMDMHGKKYESREEYTYRLGVYMENMKKAKLLQDNEQGTAVYGSTAFADLTGKLLFPFLRHAKIKCMNCTN